MEPPDWDKRYREGHYGGEGGPHALLQRFASLVRPGVAVDIAMGTGRDTLFLAGKGFRVFGLERSIEAIYKAMEAATVRGTTIFPVCGDAKDLPLKDGSADLVIVFYFLLRDSMEDIARLLKKGGILLYETFLKRQNLVDRHRNEEYLLDDGELIGYFRGMDLLLYEETMVEHGGKRRVIARYAGRKR